MKCLRIIQLIILSSIFFLNNTCTKDQDLSPEIIIEKNKIICKHIYGFGDGIIANDDYIFIRSDQAIHIFKYSKDDIKLIQEIKFSETSGIHGMELYKSTLAFGLANGPGMGTVYIYEKTGDKWDKKQEISVGRDQDNFGSSIDIDGDFMVIGASAEWADTGTYINTDVGHAYFYQKTEGEWVQKNKFLSVDSAPDDRFGSHVAIHNNHILVGGSGAPLHIYKYDQNWELLRVDSDVYTWELAHNGSDFIYASSNSNKLFHFVLNPDGSIQYFEINVGGKDLDVGLRSEGVDIYNNQVIIKLMPPDYCGILELNNNQWSDIEIIKPDDDIEMIRGLEITEDFIITGAMGARSDGDSNWYVYLFENNRHLP